MKLMTSLGWLHRWLGFALCFTILSISLSGVLLVFKKEYLWLSMPDARQELKLSLPDIAQTIETITAQYDENEIALIQTHSEDLALYKVYSGESDRAWYNQQGEQIDQWQNNGRLEDWLLDLHHRFLLGNDIGLNIAGFSGLFLVLVALLGFITWWPRRRTLKLGVIPKQIKKGTLRVSHGNLGAINFLAILLIAISGIILTYPNESRDWLLTPFLEDEDYLLSEGPRDTLIGKEHISWQRVLERALAQYPGASVRWVTPESFFSAYRVVGLQQTDGWNFSGKTVIYVDVLEGYMDVNIDAIKRPKIERLYDFLYPLHTAKLGLWYRLLLCLAGLALFFSTLFGMIAFIKNK